MDGLCSPCRDILLIEYGDNSVMDVICISVVPFYTVCIGSSLNNSHIIDFYLCCFSSSIVRACYLNLLEREPYYMHKHTRQTHVRHI